MSWSFFWGNSSTSNNGFLWLYISTLFPTSWVHNGLVPIHYVRIGVFHNSRECGSFFSCIIRWFFRNRLYLFQLKNLIINVNCFQNYLASNIPFYKLWHFFVWKQVQTFDMCSSNKVISQCFVRRHPNYTTRVMFVNLPCSNICSGEWMQLKIGFNFKHFFMGLPYQRNKACVSSQIHAFQHPCN